MDHILEIIVCCILFAGPMLASPTSHISYIVPEKRLNEIPRKIVSHNPGSELSASDYEYHIIPSDEYAVTKYGTMNSVSLLDTITLPAPIMILARIASCALSFTSWLLSNSIFIFIGVALTAAICSFTPFCTLTIDPSVISRLHNFHIPYLNNLQEVYEEAYYKYHET